MADFMSLLAAAGLPASDIAIIVKFVIFAVALAAFLARWLPPPTRAGWYASLYGVVNWLAQNKGHAANATAPTIIVKPSLPPAAALLVLSVLGLGIVACTTPPTVSTLATDAETVAAGLQGILPALAGTAGLPAATEAQIAADVAQAKAAAAALATIAAGQPAPTATVQTLVLAVNDAVKLATTPPLSTTLPPTIEEVFVAASALVPAIETAAGLAGAAPAATANVDAARLVLLGAAMTGR